MVRPWEVVDASIDLCVRIPGALRAKLPDSPVSAMLGVEESDKRIGGVAIGTFGVGG